MAFSSTEDIVLIELVAQHPAFYDLKHAQYKVHNVRENVWAEIGENWERQVSNKCYFS
jgi:hypothetical protein